jgi:hypothetical protein
VDDIALLFLAPLLAVAMYFLLSIIGMTNGNTGLYTIAVISFTVGLINNEVIDRLVGFAKSTIAGGGDKETTTVKTATKEEHTTNETAPSSLTGTTTATAAVKTKEEIIHPDKRMNVETTSKT